MSEPRSGGSIRWLERVIIPLVVGFSGAGGTILAATCAGNPVLVPKDFGDLATDCRRELIDVRQRVEFLNDCNAGRQTDGCSEALKNLVDDTHSIIAFEGEAPCRILRPQQW